MKPLIKKALVVAGILAGIAVVVIEVARLRAGAPGFESWFWIAVGALVAVLGLFELFAPDEKKPS